MVPLWLHIGSTAAVRSLNIRNITDETLARLNEAAREAGQSLQSYTHALLERDAEAQRNRDILAAFDDRSDGFSGTWQESQEDISRHRDDAPGRRSER